MAHRNPMEIPEIADVVASFLQRQRDLASCVYVSKSWRDAFLPHLWQANVLGRRSENEKPGMIPAPNLFDHDPDVVFHHRHLIHDLTLVKGFEPYVQHQYPNVHKLTISYKGVVQYFQDPVSLNLKETFPSLTQLTLTDVTLAPGFWNELEAHSRIMSLHLQSISFARGDRQAFWKVIEGLETLEMGHISIFGLDKKLQPDVKLFRMRKLLLIIGTRSDISGIHLTTGCPMLQELEWTEHRGLSISIYQILQDACWPHLKRLNMDYSLNDSELAHMLQRVWNDQEIFHLRLATCYLETEASAALGLYYNALVEVNLTDCHTVPSTTTLDLLRHCPRLEVLETRSVIAKDIVAGERWVCQRLRRLSTCFWFRKSEEGLQQVVFECLSSLVRLEELIMHVPKREAFNGHVLKFRLEDGMGQLASLKELTSFQLLAIGYIVCQIEFGMDEFEWIKEHWKKLKMVKGRLNSNFIVSNRLKVAFEGLGIEVIA